MFNSYLIPCWDKLKTLIIGTEFTAFLIELQKQVFLFEYDLLSPSWRAKMVKQPVEGIILMIS